MDKSLIQELTKNVLRAYVTALPLDQWYWPSLFPVRNTASLQYTTFIGEKGAPVMADMVSFGSSIPEKRREAVDKLFGEITKTAIKRKMDEQDYNEYLSLRNQNNVDFSDIMEYIYNDVDFVFKGVMGRLEWIALQAVSKGKLSVTTSNNAGIVTTSDIDFQIPSGNQINADTNVWKGNQSSATPIDDLIRLYRTAKEDGVTPVRTLMRQSDFYDMIATDEVKNTVTPFIYQGNVQTTNAYLGLDQVNAYLQSVRLPPITIIDQSLQMESQDGTRSNINPWEEFQVAMIPQQKLGNMLNAPIAEEGRLPQATESRRRNVLIQKYSEPEPFAEWTKGMTNSFPQFGLANEVYLLDVNSTA